ncbi:hypothetical protein J7E62_24615 [Variovorax paradoxus]|nr:hypothetical protein [Variovorax paradoxus]
MPNTTNDDARELIGHALSEVLTGDPREAIDWLDSREIDRLACAAVESIAHELEDARMFRHIAANATIKWDEHYQNATVCFPVKADFFDTVEDAVRKALGETPEGDEP